MGIQEDMAQQDLLVSHRCVHGRMCQAKDNLGLPATTYGQPRRTCTFPIALPDFGRFGVV